MKLLTEFANEEQLTNQQHDQFAQYLALLQEWNNKINLTTITDPVDIVTYHFKDSLAIDKYYDLAAVQTICDIGTGAGFPGLALKIKHPHLSIILIEVTIKKVQFLQEVINQLKLTDVIICPLDWRTFIRKTNYHVNLFVTRAALEPAEFIRIFSPSCIYNNAKLAYWAAKNWHAGTKEQKFVRQEIFYQIGNKMRKFVFFDRGADK